MGGVDAQDDDHQNHGVYALDNQKQKGKEAPSLGYDAIYEQGEKVLSQQRGLEGAYNILEDDAVNDQNQEKNGALNHEKVGASIGENQQGEKVLNPQRGLEGDYICVDAISDQQQPGHGALNYQREGDYRAICEQNQQIVEHLSIDEVLKKWVGEFGRAQILHFTLTSLAWSLEALHTLVTVFADKTPSWRCTNNGDVCTPSSSLCSLAPGAWEWVRKHESTVSEWNLVCKSSYMQGLAQSCFFVGYLLGAGLFGHLADSKLGRRGALALTCILNAVCGMLTAASPNYGVYALMRAATGICSGGLGLTSFVLGTECIGPSRRTSAAMSALYFYPLGVLLLASLAASMSHRSWRILYLITSTPSVLYCLFILPFLAESPRWYLISGRAHEALQVLKAIAKNNGTIVPSGISLSTDDQDDDNDDKLECDDDDDDDDDDNDKLKCDDDDDVKPPQQLKCDDDVKPPQQLLTQDGLAAHEEPEMQQSGIARGTLMDVFRSADTRTRMVILVVVWFASALGYYTFNLNVGNLGTNLTVSVVLNAMAEVPGYAVTTGLCHRVGRRITLISALLLSAFSSLLGGFISYKLTTSLSSPSPPSFTLEPPYNTNAPQSTLPLHALNAYNNTIHHDPFQHNSISKAHLRSFVQLICSLVGLFSIAGTYNLLYLYTAELFPTVVRNAALGLATQAGSIGSIIAPIAVLSTHVNTTLPFFIIGATSLLSGIMAIKLPETLNRPFHETLEGMRKAKEEA